MNDFIIKTLTDRNEIKTLSGCEGQATFNPLDPWYRQFMSFIYSWGGTPEDIPEPYRTIYLQYGTYKFLNHDFTCRMSAFTPAMLDTLYNELPALVNPNNNAGVLSIYLANKNAQTLKARQDLFIIFKNTLADFIQYYFSYLPRKKPNLTDEQRLYEAWRIFQGSFNATMDTYSNESKANKPWWQEIVAGIAGVLGIGFLGNIFGVSPDQGFSFRLSNGAEIQYAGVGGFGQMNLSTVLIIGAGAGLLLSMMKRKKRS